jgi:hypothetical protein
MVPFRCHFCNWRGWRQDVTPAAGKPRGMHRALTESELEELEPDNREGDRT